MTQEEKYKEALLEARAVLEPCLKYSNGKVREALDSIDKELKRFESEDEGIRKLLVWQVYRNIEDETNDLAQSVYDGIKGHDPDIEESIEDWKRCLAWLEKQKQQKPAEWSEDTIRKAVKEVGLTQHQIDWFKNNVFPPKPEWSEEDEAMRDNILRLLSCFVGTLECDSNPSLSTSYPAYQREMDWLKSLRPSWKPSEEQMAALEAATVRYQSTGLESLYEELKKL